MTSQLAVGSRRSGIQQLILHLKLKRNDDAIHPTTFYLLLATLSVGMLRLDNSIKNNQ
ncbi:MAG: hypothetical protein R2788_06905 [Saprospiraceae bacterium]